MAKPEFTPSPGNLSFAYSYLQEEFETLLCLAICLENQLEPEDPKNPKASEDIIAWRLSQVIHSKLTNPEFTQHMRELLLGHRDEPEPEAQAQPSVAVPRLHLVPGTIQ